MTIFLSTCIARLIACSSLSVLLSARRFAMTCQKAVILFRQVLRFTDFQLASVHTLHPVLVLCVL
jgi:hypothetical protein